MTLLGWQVGLGHSVPVRHRTQRPSIYRNLQQVIKFSQIQNTHCHCDSSHAPPMHTYTLHTWGCILSWYENWPQCWLWIVISASASMVTPKEHRHEHAILTKNRKHKCTNQVWSQHNLHHPTWPILSFSNQLILSTYSLLLMTHRTLR